LKFTIDYHRQARFDVGLQDVPQSLADHWWLAANGVKRIS
jgi:hypothetical protein